MLIPIFNSYQQTELEFKEATRFNLDGINDVMSGTIINKLKPNLLTYKGQYMRLILKGNQISNTSVLAAYVGKASTSGKSYDFASTPTQITVGGSGTFNIPAQGIASDVITFDTTAEVAYTFCFEISASRFARYNTAISDYPANLRPTGYRQGDLVNWAKHNVNEADDIVKSDNYSGTQDRAYVIGSILIA